MSLPEEATPSFELNDTQQMLRRTVRELAERHIAPRAAEIDEKEEYPEDIFQLLKAHQLLGVFFPENLGGGGMGFLGGCLVMEEIAGSHHIPLPVASGAMRTYRMALERGLGGENKAAMVKVWESILGVEVRRPDEDAA